MKCRPGQLALFALALLLLATPLSAKKFKADKQQDSLDQYVKQVDTAPPPPPSNTTGSLFTTAGLLAEACSDVRAHAVGDTIAIQIVESTTITQSGTIASERDFTHSSAITGVGGQTTSYLNPLLATNSATKLAGTGATNSQSSLNTVLTALVVAVLPNGLLVVEARRQVGANQQHETVVLRGVVRPADIAANNTVHSYQLFDLQLDVKGKGVINDSVRQPNIVMRTLLKAIGF